MKNILQLLERAAAQSPDKTALTDGRRTVGYAGFLHSARRVGSALLALRENRKPIAVYLDKSVEAVIAMMGVVYSGNIYTVIDTEMPEERIQKIFSTLHPAAILTDARHQAAAQRLCERVFLIEEAEKADEQDEALGSVRAAQADTDPLYILYTSGSTGMPKGAVLSHRNVLAYSAWVVDAFSLDANTVIGNQTPFYFSMSVTDIYSSIRACATLVIIPKICFSFPIKLIDCLNDNRVNTIYWVPSAYGIAANLKLFELEKPKYLEKALFAGEVMPIRTLNYWIRHLGDGVLFANLYGPTETTDICTYYVVDRAFSETETLPIGRHCDNCRVFILNDEGVPAAPGEAGELYVSGSFLSSGYYNDPVKTAEAFVQNPLNSAYPEPCYRTGDLVRIDACGEILYLGRKDHQIKRRGYRIELGEIEAAAGAADGVRECACVFDRASEKICLFYTSDRLEESDLLAALSQKLNRYLLPDVLIKLSALPYNQNGKIDRKELEKRI